MNTRNNLIEQSESDDEFKEPEIQRILSSGNKEELCNLGYFFIDKEDNEKAYSCFQKAAEQDFDEAQCCLGYCYENGIGVKKDEAKAVKWYKKAAAQNLAKAQYRLGYCYEDGIGIEKNETKAVEWYKKAAEQDFDEAQCCLGYCYENGIGIKKDEAKAVKWYKKAAEQDLAKAQYRLGYCYEDGIGIEKDEAKAVEWYTEAAVQDFDEAQYCLGYCYENGIGIKKDEAKAVEWYKKAAQQGNANAQYNLAICFLSGKGIKKDQTQAITWFQKAAETPDPEQIEEVQQWADNWLKKKLDFNANFILERLATSNNCYVPHELPLPVNQFGPNCGIVAFTAAINSSGNLPYPLYATEYEKQLSGKNPDVKDDIVFYQLVTIINKQFDEEWHSKKGEVFNVEIFLKLAEHFGVKDCEVILKEEYEEDEYKDVVCNKIREKKLLILACDSKGGMPVHSKGISAHWVFSPAFLYDKNNVPYVAVTHNNIYSLWPIKGTDGLFANNKQLPIDTPINHPYKKGGHFKKFRYSIFSVPDRNDLRAVTNRRVDNESKHSL